jgi:hypothetical protein
MTDDSSQIAGMPTFCERSGTGVAEESRKPRTSAPRMMMSSRSRGNDDDTHSGTSITAENQNPNAPLPKENHPIDHTWSSACQASEDEEDYGDSPQGDHDSCVSSIQRCPVEICHNAHGVTLSDPVKDARGAACRPCRNMCTQHGASSLEACPRVWAAPDDENVDMSSCMLNAGGGAPTTGAAQDLVSLRDGEGLVILVTGKEIKARTSRGAELKALLMGDVFAYSHEVLGRPTSNAPCVYSPPRVFAFDTLQQTRLHRVGEPGGCGGGGGHTASDSDDDHHHVASCRARAAVEPLREQQHATRFSSRSGSSGTLSRSNSPPWIHSHKDHDNPTREQCDSLSPNRRSQSSAASACWLLAMTVSPSKTHQSVRRSHRPHTHTHPQPLPQGTARNHAVVHGCDECRAASYQLANHAANSAHLPAFPQAVSKPLLMRHGSSGAANRQPERPWVIHEVRGDRDAETRQHPWHVSQAHVERTGLLGNTAPMPRVSSYPDGHAYDQAQAVLRARMENTSLACLWLEELGLHHLIHTFGASPPWIPVTASTPPREGNNTHNLWCMTFKKNINHMHT